MSVDNLMLRSVILSDNKFIRNSILILIMIFYGSTKNLCLLHTSLGPKVVQIVFCNLNVNVIYESKKNE